MITYKDRTFCITPGCMKEHALTDAVRAAAGKAGLMISTAYLCGVQTSPTSGIIYSDASSRTWPGISDERELGDSRKNPTQ